MIQIINKCLHGFILIPIIDALKRNNVFDCLQETKYSLDDLTRKTKANSAYLGVALNALESVGWVKKIDDTYVLEGDCLQTIHIPESIINFYHFPFEPYFYKTPPNDNDLFLEKLNLKAYLKTVKRNSFLENDLITFFFEGSIVLSLFFFLKNNMAYDTDKKTLSIKDISDTYIDELNQFLSIKQLGTITSKILEFTNIGVYLINSVKNTGVTLSYRPLLSQIKNLIFGHDPISYQMIKNDQHVDRTLNVIGSGSQHQIFFKDFQVLLKKFLSNRSDNKDPIAIVDMGCGDGSLLKKCYDAAPQKEKIKLVGVDFNQASLTQTRKNLEGYPYQAMQGDIIDPQKLALDLAKIGIDKHNTLHVRSFLDHNRPYKMPADSVQLERKCLILYSGKYIDTYENAIPAHCVVQSLVENFKAWSLIVGACGLVTLEVFSLPPHIIKRYLSETESLHFDTYHAFSKQLLVESHVYMMAAAESGLIPCWESFKKYPLLLPYTRVSLQHFFKKSFTIRHPCVSDIDQFIQLKTVDGSFINLSNDDIEKHIRNAPEEQYILEKNNTLMAGIFSYRVFDEDLHNNYASLSEMASLYGDTIVLTSFKCDDLQFDLMNELLRFVLYNNFIKNGIKKIIIPIECSDFDRGAFNNKDTHNDFTNSLLKLTWGKKATFENVMESPTKKENKIVSISYTYLDLIHNS